MRQDLESSAAVFGAIACVFGAMLSSLGLCIMKKSVDDAVGISEPDNIVLPRDDHDGTKIICPEVKRTLSRQESYDKIYRIALVRDGVPYCAHLQWAIGVSIYVFSQLISLLALSMIDQVTWGVLGLSSLVSNAVFASLVLHEVFTLHDFAATSVIMCGTALVVISRQSSHQEYTISQLKARFEAQPFLIYCAVLFCATIGLGVMMYRKGNTWHSSLGVGWASAASLLGSMSVLLGKCSSEIIKSLSNIDIPGSTTDTADVGDPYSITLILVMFALMSLGALHSTNMALVHGDALVMIPWLTVSNTVLVILGGMIYFSEFRVFLNVWRTLGFLIGISTAIGGAVWLQTGHEQKKQPFWKQSLRTWVTSARCCSQGDTIKACEVSEGDGLLLDSRAGIMYNTSL